MPKTADMDTNQAKQIEADLVLERAGKQSPFHHEGPRFHWRGIWVAVDSACEKLLDAEVDGVEDFFAEHGMPVTHARALQIAQEAFRTNEKSFDLALNDELDDWRVEAAGEAAIDRGDY